MKSKNASQAMRKCKMCRRLFPVVGRITETCSSHCRQLLRTQRTREVYVELKARHGGGRFVFQECEAIKIPKPVGCRPGTPEKIEVLRQRFARGELLFHPDDETIPVVTRESIDSSYNTLPRREPIPEAWIRGWRR